MGVGESEGKREKEEKEEKKEKGMAEANIGQRE